MERIPLMNIQKEEVYKNWCENALEDYYHRKRLFQKFCKDNDCNLVLAIEHIIKQIEGLVFISYSRSKTTVNFYTVEETDYTDMFVTIYNNEGNTSEVNGIYTDFVEKREFKKGINNLCNTNIVSYIFTERDVEFLTKWKEEILAQEEISLGNTSNNQNNTNIIENHESINVFIDSKLSATQASKIFERLIEEGFIDKDSDKNSFLYFVGAIKPLDKQETIKWISTKNLCAYFAEKFNEEIMEGERNILKPFENIFSTNRLASTINDYNKKGTTPKGSNTIDKILKEIRGL